jgi:hypothetical protein
MWKRKLIFVQIMLAKPPIPEIRRHLLWEYQWDSIDFSRLANVVIERVIERGNPHEWQEIVNFYGVDKILEVAENSSRLNAKHKNFARIYLQSGFIHDLQSPGHHPA